MQREIKFRAWNKHNGMMEITRLGTQQPHCDFSKAHQVNCSYDEDGGAYSVWDGSVGEKQAKDGGKKHCILMQFTGLLDKTGKEIYEGDIVRSEGNPRLMVTKFDNRYGAFIFENPDNYIDCEIVGLQNKHGDNNDLLEREVIGNIYENPSLLTPTRKAIV